MKSLPMYFPPEFDGGMARTCARLCDQAYDMYRQWVRQGRPRKEQDFHWSLPEETGLSFSSPIWSSLKWLHFLNDAEPFGFFARTGEGVGYLVLRGTETPSDWVDDLDADQVPYELVPGYGRVHHGFFKLYRSLREDLMEAASEIGVIQRLYVTGHSLGCALSTLAIPDLLDGHGFQAMAMRHYNFASPRIGDPDFAGRYNDGEVLTFRVVNTCDLVPQVPLSVVGDVLYKHVGTPVSFTAQYGTVGGNHSLHGAYRYALEHPEDPERAAPLAGPG